jgi:hypothetical protein
MARTLYQLEWDKSDRGRAYNVWCNIMHKCYDLKHENYVYYGGRGIGVDARWHNFDQFYRDMGPSFDGMTIERINNNSDYLLENCEWGSRQEQARNRRSNRLLTLGDTTQCIAAWADQTGIHTRTIRRRIDVLGWPIERALTEAVR